MTTAMTAITTPAFNFASHEHYSFPAFYTLQPNPITRSSQLQSWSSLILSYCRFHRLYVLTLADALDSPLFHNTALRKRLKEQDARTLLSWMASKEGGERIQWIRDKGVAEGREGRCWVYWRRPEEWGQLVGEWVEETGQKGTVLTLYELVEGDVTRNQEFHGMPMELLQKSLQVLVKKGKAQIFGQEGQEGVKFF